VASIVAEILRAKARQRQVLAVRRERERETAGVERAAAGVRHLDRVGGEREVDIEDVAASAQRGEVRQRVEVECLRLEIGRELWTRATQRQPRRARQRRAVDR
jgi:hypothetical protein